MIRVELLMLSGLGLLAAACDSKKEPAGDTTVVQMSASELATATKSLHQRLLDEAGSEYNFGDPVEAIEVPSNSLDHSNAVRNLHVYARSMTRKSTAPPEKHHFVADFVSDKQYKKLGMSDKDNFVFMIPSPGDTLYVMVPSDTKVQMSFLDYDTQAVFTHGDHKPPQPVKVTTATGTLAGKSFEDLVIGGCVEGSQCPSGHCAIAASGEEFTFQDYQKRMPATNP
jgi:hypothetical protein